MPILNHEHLFEQALKLVAPPPTGSPRQVDLRRAISTAYYGVFHHLLTAAADEFIGASRRSSARYALVYRSVEHRTLRDLCKEVKKQRPGPRYAPYVGRDGFGPALAGYANTILDLQERRHAADYDPMHRVRNSDAQVAIEAGKGAVRRLDDADGGARRLFLTLLLFPPR